MFLVALTSLAFAAPTTWSPLRVALVCQSSARVNACTYVQGSLDAEAIVAVVPRADAQVVLYVDVTERANDDLVLLRVVGDLPGAPSEFEQIAEVDSRASADVQRAALVPSIDRALAPFVTIAVPGAVTVAFAPPDGADEAPEHTSPWGTSAWAGGWGNWSRNFQYLSAWAGARVYRMTDTRDTRVWLAYNRDISREPSLDVGGDVIPLTSDSESTVAGVLSSVHLSEHWSTGAILRGGHDDPGGQFLGTGRLHAGVEYDWFRADDPRGNQLAVAYLIGGQADWYNAKNVLGQEQAFFPTHMVVGGGSVVFDKVELDADLSVQAELLRPLERYAVTGGGRVSLTLGDHVDLDLDLHVTQQAIPGPADIDTSDFEQVTRASYAEPLEVSGSLNFSVHFDNTNSARNDRFDNIYGLAETGNL